MSIHFLGALSKIFKAKGEQQPPSPAVSADSTVLPKIEGGAVVILPPETYTQSDLKNLITASGGKNEDPAFWRIISNERAWQAAETGTDRDSHSSVHALRGDKTAMAEHGIADPADVTYLRPIQENLPEPTESQSILIYSGDGIRNITTTHPNVPFPNTSFYHFTGDPRDSLLAVITSAPKPEIKPEPIPPAPNAWRRDWDM